MSISLIKGALFFTDQIKIREREREREQGTKTHTVKNVFKSFFTISFKNMLLFVSRLEVIIKIQC